MVSRYWTALGRGTGLVVQCFASGMVAERASLRERLSRPRILVASYSRFRIIWCMVMPTKPSRQVIAENIRKARQHRGLTQIKLAEMVGRPQPRIAEIEKGTAEIRTDTIDEIADALELSPAALLLPAESVSQKTAISA